MRVFLALMGLVTLVIVSWAILAAVAAWLGGYLEIYWGSIIEKVRPQHVLLAFLVLALLLLIICPPQPGVIVRKPLPGPAA